MKKFAFVSEISACLIILAVIMFSYRVQSQIIMIESTFTQDGEFYPFFSVDNITGLSLNADVELNSDTSLVRIVLKTADSIEYLVYEAYPLIVEMTDFEIHDACDETCFLDEVKPVSCKVLLIDASIKIHSLKYSTDLVENLSSLQLKRKLENDTVKSETMNKKIVDFNMYWQSGVSSIVQLMYNEKKESYGEKYNFRGWDYYQGGVFELLGHRNYIPESTSLTKSFDWRSRHGANCPLSVYYYDGDELGSGWMTDVRAQFSFGACWAFSANGAVESMFNLYNNSHLDFSLSVKEFLCFNPPVGDCEGGLNYEAIHHLMNFGVPTEYCFKYMQPPPPSCNGRCDHVDTIYKINSYEEINFTGNDVVKTALIQIRTFECCFTGFRACGGPEWVHI
ncbi:MAG: C1 family peptidase [Bacteroidales bacterium]